MKKEQTPDKETQQPDTAGVSDKIARNPNPRANENIREREKEPDTESADMEDEVGTEVTDGEDG